MRSGRADEWVRRRFGVLSAVLAAALYALNVPLSKRLLLRIPPTLLAALLYLGAGAGVLLLGLARACAGRARAEQPLAKSDAPQLAGMVALDIAAPVLLMLGLRSTSAANASLLNNFEIVATSLIARLVFREEISPRLWLAIALVSASSVLLSLEGAESLRFSGGSALVLLACVCWGFENNCTRKLSGKDPLAVVAVKGFGSGLGAFGIALAAGECRLPEVSGAYIAAALLLGFVAYGLSITFYIYAQRALGAAKTSAFYALAPFIGAALSFLLLREPFSPGFAAALPLMLAGAYLAAMPSKKESADIRTLSGRQKWL